MENIEVVTASTILLGCYMHRPMRDRSVVIDYNFDFHHVKICLLTSDEHTDGNDSALKALEGVCAKLEARYRADDSETSPPLRRPSARLNLLKSGHVPPSAKARRAKAATNKTKPRQRRADSEANANSSATASS